MMARRLFFIFSILVLLLIAAIYPLWHPVLYFLILIVPLILIGICDFFSTHNILRNYPLIGHIRYIFEFVRPEIQQYFVATNLSGRPYSREARSLVYQRAQHALDTHPFGTEHDINSADYEFGYHSLNVKKIPEDAARITVGGPDCKKPYNASRLNISAMSFGALSDHAVMALNLGAKHGNFAHNTGEGGLSQYHLRYGGDIIFQLGTAYFGARTLDGKFDPEKFKEKANLDVVKMIEIKLSQGAKPSHGGLLPAAKISPEIAKIRGIEVGKDCLSPPTHSEFSTPEGLLDFVVRLRDMCGGKPVGFKLCVGKRSEFMGIVKAMLKTGILPDFITVDGAEGGTGAAPLEYTNRLGTPINEGLAFVHNCLVGANLRDKIRVIASGKVYSGFDVVMKIALGADMVNLARAMLFSIGCIQALRCHTNTCPTGVTTQDPWRTRAIKVKHKSKHVAEFHKETVNSFLDLTGAMGIAHPDQLTPDLILLRRTEGEAMNFAEVMHYVEPGCLLDDISKVHPIYREAWENSSEARF